VRFSDVQHQDRALSIVRRAMASGRTHHAYLFEGPEGVGKELAGRALAARLLCEAPDLPEDADACGVCRACQLFAAGNHPDFHLIHRGLHKQHPDRTIRSGKGLFLVVDVVRHFLIEPSATSPNLGRRRVFLIRDAERMNEGAQNALLKTLEEPPGDARLILVTSSGERLLPTIRSRCQRVPFALLPPDFVEQQLQTLGGVAPAPAAALAVLAQGRLGAALHWHRIDLLTTLYQVAQGLDSPRIAQPEPFGKMLLEVAQELATRNVEYANNNGDDENGENGKSRGGSKNPGTDELRSALKLVLLLIASIQRDALLAQVAGPTARKLPPDLPAVERLAATWTADQLAERIEAVTTAERMLDRNVAPQLVGEHLAIALTGEAGES